MKNLLLAGVATIILACASGSSSDSKAYICNNQKTEVYHLDKDCSALKRCTHEVKEVTESIAINKLHKRLCGREK